MGVSNCRRHPLILGGKFTRKRRSAREHVAERTSKKGLSPFNQSSELDSLRNRPSGECSDRGGAYESW
jgi:hypothetical protein